MASFESLSFPEMMGNLASELTRVQRVLSKNDLVTTKVYLWESLKMLEIIKNKYPNSEIFRLYEYLAGMWYFEPEMLGLKVATKYTLNFYIASLS